MICNARGELPKVMWPETRIEGSVQQDSARGGTDTPTHSTSGHSLHGAASCLEVTRKIPEGGDLGGDP